MPFSRELSNIYNQHVAVQRIYDSVVNAVPVNLPALERLRDDLDRIITLYEEYESVNRHRSDMLVVEGTFSISLTLSRLRRQRNFVTRQIGRYLPRIFGLVTRFRQILRDYNGLIYQTINSTNYQQFRNVVQRIENMLTEFIRLDPMMVVPGFGSRPYTVAQIINNLQQRAGIFSRRLQTVKVYRKRSFNARAA